MIVYCKKQDYYMADQNQILSEVTQGKYKYGFYTDIETDIIDKGLNESVIKLIWEKKEET